MSTYKSATQINLAIERSAGGIVCPLPVVRIEGSRPLVVFLEYPWRLEEKGKTFIAKPFRALSFDAVTGALVHEEALDPGSAMLARRFEAMARACGDIERRVSPRY